MSDTTILIADDDAVSARFLTRLLTREGHQVHGVETGEAALAACAARGSTSAGHSKLSRKRGSFPL